MDMKIAALLEAYWQCHRDEMTEDGRKSMHETVDRLVAEGNKDCLNELSACLVMGLPDEQQDAWQEFVEKVDCERERPAMKMEFDKLGIAFQNSSKQDISHARTSGAARVAVGPTLPKATPTKQFSTMSKTMNDWSKLARPVCAGAATPNSSAKHLRLPASQPSGTATIDTASASWEPSATEVVVGHIKHLTGRRMKQRGGGKR